MSSRSLGTQSATRLTLRLSRFRIIEPTQGYITIDGQNISNIPLQTLRSRLAMIPQDAPLFTGTVRSNLDPFNISSDEEIWNVLTYVHLALHISALPRDILTEVKDSDSVFSVGQRQLLSLARALLSNARILILDEATASVDLATDHVLQDMLRSDLLKGRTVITIAHRMNTIIDSDRVVVLDAGKVVEFGTPKDLARREGGVFRELMVKAGLGEELILS